jgi:hypothetical protein
MVSNIVSAVVEAERKRTAARHGLLDSPGATVPMSVFWMAPQYAIHGMADAFMDVGRMEFLYDQAPESMRSSAAVLYWLTMSAGSYMGTLLVTTVDERTKGEGGVASGQPQQREAGSILLAGSDTAGDKRCLLRHMCKAIHLQEVRGSKSRGHR